LSDWVVSASEVRQIVKGKSLKADQEWIEEQIAKTERGNRENEESL